MMISVVIPCYNCEQSILRVVEELCEALEAREGSSYEIILVNDGSADGTAQVLHALAESRVQVRALELARNYGQHMAILAGLREAQGAQVVCCDDDGESPVAEVGVLLDALDDGADVVYGRWPGDHERLLRRAGSGLNDCMARWIIGKPKNLTVTSFWAMRAFVIKNMCAYRGLHPYFLGIILRSTRRIRNVPLIKGKRLHGVSGYTLQKLIRFWVSGATNYSLILVRYGLLLGTLLLVAGTALLGTHLGLYFADASRARPPLWLGGLFLVGGAITSAIGITGFYLARLFMAKMQLPQYVVRPGGSDDAPPPHGGDHAR